VSFSKRHTFTPCWEECWICRESQDARQQEAARVTQVANGQPALAQDPVVELEGEAAALYAELQTRIGEETHVGEWLQVTQALINQFATVTGDHQWIHTDPRACGSRVSFQTTIAHGFLTLATAAPVDRFGGREHAGVPDSSHGGEFRPGAGPLPLPHQGGQQYRARTSCRVYAHQGRHRAPQERSR
jgi:hypothetical protein